MALTFQHSSFLAFFLSVNFLSVTGSAERMTDAAARPAALPY
jgi:hypothetical protein